MSNVQEYINKLNYNETVEILDGQSVSTVLNTYGQSVVGLFIKSGFSGASLTIQTATESGGTFYDVKNIKGTNVSITFSSAGFYQLNATDLSGARFIRFISNIAQTGDTTLTFALRAL